MNFITLENIFMSKKNIKKSELVIGSLVQTVQGIGKVEEIRKNRVYLKLKGEKSEIPFSYKDISGIPITVDAIKSFPKATENHCIGITKDQDKTYAAYIGGGDGYSFIIWKSYSSKESDPDWNLAMTNGSSDDPDQTGDLMTFSGGIKYFHELQEICGYLSGIINLELLLK